MSNVTDLDPKTSASPVMISVIKMRFRQHLRIAIEAVRDGEPRRAAHHAGIAEGQAAVLYDTSARAWPYLTAVQAIRKAIPDDSVPTDIEATLATALLLATKVPPVEEAEQQRAYHVALGVRANLDRVKASRKGQS